MTATARAYISVEGGKIVTDISPYGGGKGTVRRFTPADFVEGMTPVFAKLGITTAMCSSTCDFPEEGGLDGVDVHAMITEALWSRWRASTIDIAPNVTGLISWLRHVYETDPATAKTITVEGWPGLSHEEATAILEADELHEAIDILTNAIRKQEEAS